MDLGIIYEEMAADVLRINGKNMSEEENACFGLTIFWRRDGEEEPVEVTEKEVKEM